MENLIERSLLGTNGPAIDLVNLPSTLKKVKSVTSEEMPLKTLKENERDHILVVLRCCNWKISGPGGAAEILDMHVSTLNSRIRKLGIEKERLSVEANNL